MVVAQDYRQKEGCVTAHDWSVVADHLHWEIHACRGGARVLRRPLTSALIDVISEEFTNTALLRSLSLPGSTLETIVATTGSASLACRACSSSARVLGMFVSISFPVDIAALKACCARRLQAAVEAALPAPGTKGDPVWRNLFSVEGHVVGAVVADIWRLTSAQMSNANRGSSFSSEHFFLLTTRGELCPPQHWSAPLSKSMGVIWWWCIDDLQNCDVTRLRQEAEAVVQTCRIQPPPPKRQWTPVDLSQAHVAQLESEARAEGLPEHHFFDGVSYIDASGHRSKQHPRLEHFIEQHLNALNKEVEAWNSGVLQICEGLASEMTAAN